MKIPILKILILGLFISFHSCKSLNESELQDEEIWHLGWRMIENSWGENIRLAELQFDSLLSFNTPIDEVFLMSGLETKVELSKEKDVLSILQNQTKEIISRICVKKFARNLSPCNGQTQEEVEHPDLQLEIIKLFVDDQAVRGNVKEETIIKYQLDSTAMTTYDMGTTDEINRERLKEIFKEFGFPTRKQVGKEAMNGIFFIIQHADGDKAWQKSQLPNIKSAIKRGDLTKQKYAYLYDRIQVNSGKQQRYGTQFLQVDRANKITELKETEDLDNLDQRRREMGMMPIAVYKRLMLRN